MWSRTSHRRHRTNRARTIRNSDTCHICGQALNPELKFPHPMSTTADHLVPIADGGDNLGRLAAAHLRCNQRRWSQASKAVRPGRQW